jgi:hypothetical protein
LRIAAPIKGLIGGPHGVNTLQQPLARMATTSAGVSVDFCLRCGDSLPLRSSEDVALVEAGAGGRADCRDGAAGSEHQGAQVCQASWRIFDYLKDFEGNVMAKVL